MSSTSLLYGPSTVAEKSLIQHEFNDQQRATMGSFTSLFKSLFFAIAALFIGIIADHTNPRIAMLFGKTCELVSVLLIWKLYKLIKTK